MRFKTLRGSTGLVLECDVVQLELCLILLLNKLDRPAEMPNSKTQRKAKQEEV